MASYVGQDEDLLIFRAELNANDDLLGIGTCSQSIADSRARQADYLTLFS